MYALVIFAVVIFDVVAFVVVENSVVIFPVVANKFPNIAFVKLARVAKKFVEVEFLVDSGAVYSLVPGKFLDTIGIEPYKEMSFALADGTSIKRRVSSAYFEYENEGGPAPVIYGEEGDTPLLGATTLESIGLVLNPFSRTLHLMRMLLANFKNIKL